MLIKVTDKNLRTVLKRSVRILESGGIIAYPTETFYGLGVKFDNKAALKRLYELKQRPEIKPMPVIIGNMDMLSLVALSVSDKAYKLMAEFWPGPLTIILDAKKGLSKYLTAGTDKVAVRIPGESFALHLAKAAGYPITATSANISGMLPAEDTATVKEYFGEKIDLIIDSGRTPGGLPSTIVDISDAKIRILRKGAISSSSLRN